MTKNEKLADRIATRDANISDRDAMTRVVNNRTWRRKQVANAIGDIRVARQRIMKAILDIKMLRSASDETNGMIYKKISERDARIQALAQEIAVLRNEARIERAMNLMDEINKMEKDGERAAAGIPRAIQIDDIIS